MIYTDGIHLVSDEDDYELHAFAKKIGLKRAWFQFDSKHAHYDLTSKRMVEKALSEGAIKVSTRELINILKPKENS